MEITLDTSLSTMIQETVSKMEESSKRMRATMEAFNTMSTTALESMTDHPLLEQLRLESGENEEEEEEGNNGEGFHKSRTGTGSVGLLSLTLKRMTKPIAEMDDEDDDDDGVDDEFVDARDDRPSSLLHSTGYHGS